MTLKLAWRSATRKSGYVPFSVQKHRDANDADEQCLQQRHGFAVAQVRLQGALTYHREVRGEIDRRENLEERQHEFDGYGIEIADALVVRGKAAERQCRKGMAHCVEPAHAAELQRQRAGERQTRVDVPERLHRMRDARRQFAVLHRPRRLRAIELHSADAEQRQNGDRRADDAHAADPMQEMAPEIERCRQLIESERMVEPVVVNPETLSK